MKLILIALLFTINLQASVRVQVTNDKNGRQFKGEFDTQSKADKWIAKQIANDSWGKGERWVEVQSGDDVSRCIEQKDHVDEDGKTRSTCKLPKEYSIEIVDITQEVAQRKAEKLAKKQRIEELKGKRLKLDELVELLRAKGVIE